VLAARGFAISDRPQFPTFVNDYVAIACSAETNAPVARWEFDRDFDAFHCQSRNDECHGAIVCPNDSRSECCAEPSCDYLSDHFTCESQDTCDPC
jgi:hypothetical protein